MLSLRFIRENPDVVRDSLRRRHDSAPIDEILTLDREWRDLLTQVEALRAERNTISQQVNRAATPADREPLVAQSRTIGVQIRELETQANRLEAQVNNLLLYVPNLPHASVPDGASAGLDLGLDLGLTWA